MGLNDQLGTGIFANSVSIQPLIQCGLKAFSLGVKRM
jgi:hypothetical protein